MKNWLSKNFYLSTQDCHWSYLLAFLLYQSVLYIWFTYGMLPIIQTWHLFFLKTFNYQDLLKLLFASFIIIIYFSKWMIKGFFVFMPHDKSQSIIFKK